MDEAFIEIDWWSNNEIDWASNKKQPTKKTDNHSTEQKSVSLSMSVVCVLPPIITYQIVFFFLSFFITSSMNGIIIYRRMKYYYCYYMIIQHYYQRKPNVPMDSEKEPCGHYYNETMEKRQFLNKAEWRYCSIKASTSEIPSD